MFAKIIKVESRYAAFLIAFASAIAIGSVARGDDARQRTTPRPRGARRTATPKSSSWPSRGRWCRRC